MQQIFSWLRPRPTPRSSHLEFGAYGERLAVEFLKRRGYRIVVTNFVAPIGVGLHGRRVTGELDIIAIDESAGDSVFAFVEVKTRRSATVAAPEAAVDLRKQRQIIRAARVYLRLMSLTNEPYRFDVVSIIGQGGAPAEITLLRGYFTEASFFQSQWWSRGF